MPDDEAGAMKRWLKKKRSREVSLTNPLSGGEVALASIVGLGIVGGIVYLAVKNNQNNQLMD